MVRRNYLATARINRLAGAPPSHGRKVEDAIVRAVIQPTDGLKLQVDVVMVMIAFWPHSGYRCLR
jgi:hypothetical protein